MKRSKEEVQKEIETLREMKPKVRQFSAFGDDHHAAIDAQIEVLQEGLDDCDVYERFEEDASNILDEAIHALEWMSGEKDEAPSVDWKDLVIG
jgi:hypothetical protein